MLSFGERLKKARERKGLTQAQVMKQTDITDKSLSRYENNSTAPDPEKIRRLILLYDVSSDYIMGLSSVMGHAPVDFDGADFDAHKKLDILSEESRKKAEEYIEMLIALDKIK